MTAGSGSAVPGASPEAEEDALEELIGRIIDRADEMLVPIATALGRAAFRRRANLELLRGNVDDMAALVVAAATSICDRRPDEISVQVWQPERGGSVIDIHTEDGPFLVSTLNQELARRAFDTESLLHPVLGVERADDGTVTNIVPARGARTRESWIHARLRERLDSGQREELRDSIATVMADARRVTDDFGAMVERVKEMAAEAESDGVSRHPASEADEAVALLTWLLDDHFIFLGARDLDLVGADGDGRWEVDPDSTLGLWSPEATGRLEADPVPPVDDDRLLHLTRTRRRSTVHRNERMLCLALERIRGDRVTGQRQLVGLLSQRAIAQPATSVPLLRTRLRAILEAEDVVDHSHEERAFRQLYEAVPKDELFTMSTGDIRTALVDLLESRKRESLRLVVNYEDHGVSALITMPRDRFNADLRRGIQALLVRRFDADGVDYRLSLTEGDNALLHFALTGTDEQDVRLDVLQQELVEMSRTWKDRLREAARRAQDARHVTAADGPTLQELADRWGDVLPATYTAATDPEEAVDDLVELDQLPPSDGSVRVRVLPSGPGRLQIKLFKLGQGIELSSVLPMLESLGLVVIEEVPHLVTEPPVRRVSTRAEGPMTAHIHALEVRTPRRGDAQPEEVDVDVDGVRLSAALRAIWDERAEADSLNRLVLLAGLDWRQVGVLRAYRRFRRQVGTSFTEAYQNSALCRYPVVARGLIDLFETRFDPDHPAVDGDDSTRSERVEEARQQVLAGMEEVTQLDQDRILRGYLRLVEATLRTNHFVRPRRGWLSLKFDSARVPYSPAPVPWCEIFVYSPRMEGVHLRAGPVARGGLRWSDRLEDVRTEVLGLMKAQVTKNSMIVPTGSKGGFVLKQRPADPDALREEVRAQYEVFIRGLLELTDNVVDGRIVHPERVIAPDGDDAYLVVAADRGTATFSDLANRVSAEYDYWLGDAFASGGSRGYDHKEMGITARGAWVVVRRHFHELDTDVQTDPVRIAGIGDMSGDVFGNAMLLSRAVRLVAAFDHRDIFIDPDPDPETSFAERERLFAMERSTWQDYDRSLLSTGGGVWSRSAKSITLSEEAQKLLGVDDATLTPPEVVRAILRAHTDLLFAGGVGTFVKSSTEDHDDVGDKANEAVRIDGTSVGARVIGEGGNLAVTQRGRIEYARRGGKVNLDAIDNAAGVATSDAEVNIKILLQMAVERGEIDGTARDELLAAVRDSVADHVLHRVWRQAWAVSRELAVATVGMEAYEQLLSDLEASGHVDRQVDVLPSDEEIHRRREAGAGMTRPELGVLLGASKRHLIARLLDSDVPDDPTFRPLLRGGFPDRIAQRFPHLLDDHRLRREIIATELAGEVVDRMGVTYVSRTAHERGCAAAEVAASYWVARQVSRATAVWRMIDQLEGRIVPALQAELTEQVDAFMDACTRAYLRELHALDLASLIDSDRNAFDELGTYMQDLRGTHAALHAGRIARWTDVGIEQDLAERVVALQELQLSPDVAEVARRLDVDARTVADAFIAVTDRLPLDALHDRVERITPVGRWERWQQRSLVDELRDLRRQVAISALSAADGDGRSAVDVYLDRRATVLRRADNLMERLERQSDAGLAAVSVVVAALRGVLD